MKILFALLALAAVEFPAQPDKVVWLDVKAFSHNRPGAETPQNPTAAVYGKVRSTQRGEVGDPWQGVLPIPSQPCSHSVDGMYDVPPSPWYCPNGYTGVRGPWTIATPPPLTQCTATTEPREQHGYVCTKSNGGGYLWWPRVWV